MSTITNDTAGTTGGQSDDSLNAIDAAINAQKARKAGKPAASTATAEGSTPTEKAKRTVLTPDQRIERTKQNEIDRASRKKARDDAREAAKKAKPAAPPAHLKKVAKAAEGLPVLTETARLIYDEATAGLSQAEVAALSAHLNHFARVQATTGSLTVEVKEGQLVEIVGGDARFLGKRGVARKPGRIRVLVDFPGSDKPGYFFTAHCTPVIADQAEEGTDEEAPVSDETAAA
jgi:hypothetical protein